MILPSILNHFPLFPWVNGIKSLKTLSISCYGFMMMGPGRFNVAAQVIPGCVTLELIFNMPQKQHEKVTDVVIPIQSSWLQRGSLWLKGPHSCAAKNWLGGLFWISTWAPHYWPHHHFLPEILPILDQGYTSHINPKRRGTHCSLLIGSTSPYQEQKSFYSTCNPCTQQISLYQAESR